jgi:DNA-directed RNA polymerase subunit RPC12/RpoP
MLCAFNSLDLKAHTGSKIMNEDIRFPTWKDLGIPSQFVDSIKNIEGDNLLEQLIYEKVFRHTRRMQYVYICTVCGHHYRPKKSVEDYCVCDGCGVKSIIATQHLRGWNRVHQLGASNSEAFAQEVLMRMRVNYSTYFPEHLEEFQSDNIVVFRWRQSKGYVANYLSGNEAEELSTAKALCKASLLVPFIWDDSFDWETKTKKAPGRQSSILPTIYEWVQRGNNQ